MFSFGLSREHIFFGSNQFRSLNDIFDVRHRLLVLREVNAASNYSYFDASFVIQGKSSLFKRCDFDSKSESTSVEDILALVEQNNVDCIVAFSGKSITSIAEKVAIIENNKFTERKQKLSYGLVFDGQITARKSLLILKIQILLHRVIFIIK